MQAIFEFLCISAVGLSVSVAWTAFVLSVFAALIYGISFAGLMA